MIGQLGKADIVQPDAGKRLVPPLRLSQVLNQELVGVDKV
jgi:hypothetical protein